MHRSVVGAVLALGMVLGVPAHAEEGDDAKVAEARRAFSVGVNLMTDPDGGKYAEALVQFKRAAELTGTWKVLGNIGICAMKLERVGEAMDAFQRYLAEGEQNIPAEERRQVQRDLDTLRGQFATIKLTFPAAGVRVTDQRRTLQGAVIGNDYTVTERTAALRVTAGSHYVVAHLPRGNEGIDMELTPGQSVEHAFGNNVKGPPAPPPPVPVPSVGGHSEVESESRPADTGPATGSDRPIPTSVWISGGATVALLAGSVVTGLMASSKKADFDDANGKPGHTLAEIQDFHDSATSMATINTVLTGATVVGAGVTLFLYFTRPAVPKASAGPVWTPWVSADGRGAGLVYWGAL